MTWIKQDSWSRVREYEKIKVVKGDAEIFDTVEYLTEDASGFITGARLKQTQLKVGVGWDVYCYERTIQLPDEEFAMIEINQKNYLVSTWYFHNHCWWNVKGGSGMTSEDLVEGYDLDKGTDFTIKAYPSGLFQARIVEVWEKAFAAEGRKAGLLTFDKVKELLIQFSRD